MGLRFECKHCLKKFKSSDSRHHHLSKYHGYSPISYKCEHCPKSFKYKHNYIVHLSEGHKVANMRFECGQCTSSFKYSHHLVQHMRLVHDPEKKTYKCKECSKTFERRDGFVQHMKLHAPTVTLHRCELCQRMYRSKAGLKLHINMNHNENFQRSQCPLCPSDFKWPHHLKQHISKMHFRPDDSLTDLKQTKSMGNRCGLCMVAFAEKLGLLLHLKKLHNLDVDIFKCCQCTAVFNLKEPLKLHLEKHQERDDFTHQCQQCYPVISPKLYMDAADLNTESLHDPDYELRPEDEVTDFEECIMEHPDIRRMIKFKLRHTKTNEMLSESQNNADHEDSSEWNSCSESYATEVASLEIEGNVNDSTESVSGIGVNAIEPDRNTYISESCSLVEEYGNENSVQSNEPEDNHSYINKDCLFSCGKCEATFATANSLSVHCTVVHSPITDSSGIGSNTQSAELTSEALKETTAYSTPKRLSTQNAEISSKSPDLSATIDTSLPVPQVSSDVESPSHGQDNTLSHNAQSIDHENLVLTSPVQANKEACAGDSASKCIEHSGIIHIHDTPANDRNDKELVVQLKRLKETQNLKMSIRDKKNLRCGKCTAVFEDSLSFKEHEMTIHSKEKLIFKCEKCNQFFAKRSMLQKHLFNHIDDNSCNNASGSKRTISRRLIVDTRPQQSNVNTKKHTILRQKPKIIKCKQCNMTFKTAVEVARHVRFVHMRGFTIATQKTSFKCKLCPCTFTKLQALAIHSKLTHKKKHKIKKNNTASQKYMINNNKRKPLIKDSDMNQERPNLHQEALVSHSNMEPANITNTDETVLSPAADDPDLSFKGQSKGTTSEEQSDVYDCGKCKLFFKSKLALLRHISEKHMNIKNVRSKKYSAFKSDSSGVVIKCVLCEDIFDNRDKFIKHAEQRHSKSHHCIACNQLFDREREFIQHMKMEHRHKCGVCSIAFVRKEKLLNHLRTQHKDRPQHHKCDACNAVFRLEASLAKHMDEKHHTNPESVGTKEPQLVTKEMEMVMHKCVHCYALFPLRESLQRHVQLEHDVGSVHKCGECTAVFNDIEEFKEHLQIEHMMQM